MERPARQAPGARAPLMRSPRSLEIELTARCNLRCRYCYFSDSPARDSDDLPTAEWLRFFAELGRLGVMRLRLGGGEPFLRQDLPALIDGIVQQRMRFSLLSNGALIDDVQAARLAASGRCDGVQISVDGAREESHDAFRGAGSFAAARRAIENLQRRGVPVSVRVTLHPHNVDELEAIARLLLDELGLPAFSSNAASYVGRGRRHAGQVALSVPQRQRALEAFVRLQERYRGRLIAMAGPLAELESWRRLEAARRGGDRPPGGGRLSGCGCVFSELTVRADGVLVPCSLLSHLELGRINRDALDVLWQQSPVLQRLRARGDIALTSRQRCRGCAFIDACTGNCPGLAYSESGELDQPSRDGCLRLFLEAGGRLPPPADATPAPSASAPRSGGAAATGAA